MFRVIIIILILTSVCFSQQSSVLKKESLSKADDIVRGAKDAAGLSASMTSFQIKLHTLADLQAQGIKSLIDTQDEITVSPDNKIRMISEYKGDGLSNSGLTRLIWSENKFRQTAEFESSDGQRRVIDTTDGIQLSQNVVNAIKSKKPGTKLPTTGVAASRAAAFSNKLWGLVFPFTLVHPIESSAKYEYIGRAQAGEQVANFVQTTSANSHLIQLFFDEKTRNLLLLIDKYSTTDKEFETKYYYSNREKREGVLIPTKIKIEYKTTPKGETPKIFFEYIDLLGFEVNPTIKPDIFKIN